MLDITFTTFENNQDNWIHNTDNIIVSVCVYVLDCRIVFGLYVDYEIPFVTDFKINF